MNPFRFSRRVIRTTEPSVHRLRERMREEILHDLSQATIHLSPPKAAVNRMHEIVAKTTAGYSIFHHSIRGSLKLRQAVASIRSSLFSEEIGPENVMMTVGANHAFAMCLKAFLDPFEKVAIPSPYFFNQVMACDLEALKVMELSTQGKNGFAIDPVKIEDAIIAGAKAICLVNPANPSGRLVSRITWNALHKMVVEHRAIMLVDETYFPFHEDHEKETSGALSLKSSVVIGSFSKWLGWAGLRLGYVIADKKTIEVLLKCQDASVICPSWLAQDAIVPAILDMKKHTGGLCMELNKRIGIVRKALNSARVRTFVEEIHSGCPPFVFVKLVKPNDPGFAETVVRDLAERHKVGVLSGDVFGREYGDYIRICVGNVGGKALKAACDCIERSIIRSSS